MPNRVIKESICASDTLASISAEAERLFFRLTVKVDDFGLYEGRPKIVRANCFAAMLDQVSEDDVDQWLSELETVGLIQQYTIDGKRFLKLSTWDKHQRRRAKDSKYPQPPSSAVKRQQMSAYDSGCGHPPSSDGLARAGANGNGNEVGNEVENENGNGNDARESRHPAAVVINTLKDAGILMPSATEVDTLLAFIEDDGLDLDAVVFAIETAAIRGKRRVDYMSGILRRWRDAGLLTQAQVVAHEAGREARASPDEYPDLTARNAEIMQRKAEVMASGQSAPP